MLGVCRRDNFAASQWCTLGKTSTLNPQSQCMHAKDHFRGMCYPRILSISRRISSALHTVVYSLLALVISHLLLSRHTHTHKTIYYPIESNPINQYNIVQKSNPIQSNPSYRNRISCQTRIQNGQPTTNRSARSVAYCKGSTTGF